MANSSYYSHLAEERIFSNVDGADFTTGITRSTSCNDLEVIRIEETPVQAIPLCKSPKLKYLNLLDYEGKKGDFHSSIFGCISVKGQLNALEDVIQTFEEYTSASMFYFYVNHLRVISNDSIDLLAYNQRIRNVIKVLNCEHPMRNALFNRIIQVYCELPSDKTLLPLILKHLCNCTDLIMYAVRYLITSYCNPGFLKELLDACLKSRFNFWTIWERNRKYNATPLCFLTYAYFKGKIDFLRVLLDYGFRRTRACVQTLEIVVEEHCRGFNYMTLREILYNCFSRSRTALITEVFLFVCVFLDSYRSPERIAQCFQLAWNARKDPYVTKQEVLDVIQNRYGRYLRENELLMHRLWFEKPFDAFQALIPGEKGLVGPQPRSLKHLCRCTIRETLNENWQMPYGVSTLPVPEQIKSYILLK